MLKIVNLLAKFLVDIRIAMPKEIDPPARNTINIGFVVKIIDIHAFAALYRYEWVSRLVIVHLRAGVPNMDEILGF